MFLGENPVHINASKEDIAEVVIMPGDPLRAKYIAENFLDEAREVCNLRNMLGFTGNYKGKKVTVMGSGMGMPSMSIYSFELFHYFDVKKIIRIGTCGAVSEKAGIMDIILSSDVYSESNFAYTYNDYKGNIVYPSEKLNNRIIEKSKELGINLHVGTICTMDVFGPFIDYDRVLNRIPKDVEVLAEEMEAFALVHVANSFGREATCLATVVDSKYSDTVLSSEKREKGLNDMIKLALESLL